MEQAKSKTPDILTPGFLDDSDMTALYSMAEAFIVPTHYEGFGIPALEAITCGCPTISAYNSSLPEVLGEAALFYKTGDAKELAQAINSLMENPELQKDLRSKGLTQASKFSFKTMVEQTAVVYSQALNSRETPRP